MCTYVLNKQAQASRQAHEKSEFSTSQKYKTHQKLSFPHSFKLQL